MFGALAWTVGEGVNMLIGHTAMFVQSGFKRPAFKEGAFVYDIGGATPWAISNVIGGSNKSLYETPAMGGSPFSTFQHEQAHTRQGPFLGPAYLPAHIASQIVGGAMGAFDPNLTMNLGERAMYGTHAYNVFERGWIFGIPSY